MERCLLCHSLWKAAFREDNIITGDDNPRKGEQTWELDHFEEFVIEIFQT